MTEDIASEWIRVSSHRQRMGRSLNSEATTKEIEYNFSSCE